LGQVRGFLDAVARTEAAEEARLLSVIAIGTRSDSRQLDQTLDRLSDRANCHSDR
jgi:hypothetical protein